MYNPKIVFHMSESARKFRCTFFGGQFLENACQSIKHGFLILSRSTESTLFFFLLFLKIWKAKLN